MNRVDLAAPVSKCIGETEKNLELALGFIRALGFIQERDLIAGG